MSERFVTALGLAALVGCGILSALLEMFLIPLYSGASLVPITVVFAILGTVLLVWLGRELMGLSGWRLAPFAGWLVTIVVFSLYTRPEGDVIVPGGGGGLEWVGYGVVLGGALAGTVAAVLLSPSPDRRVGRAGSSERPGRRDQPVKG